MSQQNRSAQRRPANSTPNLKQEPRDDGNQQRPASGLNDPQKSRMDAEPSLRSRMELLDKYSQLLDELNMEHADTTQSYTNLESEIMAREISCGRLMRQYLEIGEQIRQQKESISFQKEELRRVRMKREQSSMQKDAVVRKIAELASRSTR